MGGGNAKNVESHPCPASCRFTISGKDPYPLCIMYMVVKHAKEALAGTGSYDHCCAMALQTLQRRLRVAVASKEDPCLSEAMTQPGANSGGATDVADMLWEDRVELERLVKEFPLLLDQLLDSEDKDICGEDDEEDMNLGLL